jgi:inosine-uridine nucleoside N-ribohydrolase
VGYLIDDRIADTRSAFVSCETAGKHTHGMTIVDFEMREGKSPNAEVAMVAYPEIFGKLLEEMVGFYMNRK